MRQVLYNLRFGFLTSVLSGIVLLWFIPSWLLVEWMGLCLCGAIIGFCSPCKHHWMIDDPFFLKPSTEIAPHSIIQCVCKKCWTKAEVMGWYYRDQKERESENETR